MNITHRFPIGSHVEVRPNLLSQPWRRAVVQRLAPYLGRPGYYVSYPDAREQWECGSGWVSESCVRECSDCLGSGALRRDGDPIDDACPSGCAVPT